MDGAQVSHPYSVVEARARSQQVGGPGGGDAAFGMSLGQIPTGVQI